MTEFSMKNLNGKFEDFGSLAFSYMNSYNTLSNGYKSPEEMKLYTYSYFLKKLKSIAADTNSETFVLSVANKEGKMEPKGFIRYSKIPEYYKEVANGVAKDKEVGELDGHQYNWERKVNFSENVALSDKTVIVNQIYLDPSIQSAGFGTKLFDYSLPEIKRLGYEDMIIEYNSENHKAKRFYMGVLGMSKIAETEDLDHILGDKENPNYCISDVEISYNKIDDAIARVSKIEKAKQGVVVLARLPQKQMRLGR